MPWQYACANLRQTSWPDIKITQAHLAEALGERQVRQRPVISSWERVSATRRCRRPID